MSNVLSIEKREQIIALGRLGWSLLRIEAVTGVRRETASGYLKAAGIAVRAPGGWGRRAPKPANEVTTDPIAGSSPGPVPRFTPFPKVLLFLLRFDGLGCSFLDAVEHATESIRAGFSPHRNRQRPSETRQAIPVCAALFLAPRFDQNPGGDEPEKTADVLGRARIGLGHRAVSTSLSVLEGGFPGIRP